MARHFSAAFALFVTIMNTAAGADRIVFDTDSGPFNDDGSALVMLLQSGAPVDAVTIVPGNVWAMQGAEYMLANLKMMHRADLPLFVGAGAPLLHTPAMARAAAKEFGPQSYIGAFARTRPESRAQLLAPFYGFSGLEPRRESAVDFIVQTVESHPGEVTLFAIGPMTNIAMALRLRPEIETRIKRIVFMGGAVHAPGNTTKAAEFNFWFDPEAARIVLRSRIPQKIMFALDICNLAPLTRAMFDRIVAVKTPVTAIYEEDFGRGNFPAFLSKTPAHAFLWDELAAEYLVDPSIVTASRQMHLDVETRFSADYGRVVPLDRTLVPDATPIDVALEVQRNKVEQIYVDLMTRPVR